MNKKRRWAGRRHRKAARENCKDRAVFVEMAWRMGRLSLIADPELNVFQLRQSSNDSLPEQSSIVILKWAGLNEWRIKKV